MEDHFYERIVEESPLGYAYHKMIYDDEGFPVDYVFLEVNAAFEKCTGLFGKDIIGKRGTEVLEVLLDIKENDFDWISVYGDIASNNKNAEFEAYSKPLSQWYHVKAYAPRKDYFVTIVQNISQNIESQNVLFETENRYRSIFENAPIGITYMSLDGCFLDVNKEFNKILGYNLEELSLKNFLDITYVEDRKVNQEGALKMNNGEIPLFHMQKRYIHKNGSIVWCNLASTLLHDANGTPLYFINMVTDITDQKQKEEDKLYIENLIEQMGEVAKIGGWSLDIYSNELTWTQEISKIYDIDVVSKGNLDFALRFYTEESKERLEGAIKTTIEDGTPYNLELEIISNRGVRKWVKEIGMPVLDDGKIVKLRGSLQDITDFKNTEVTLRKSELQYRLIAENAADVISVYNRTKQKFVYISPSIEKLRGITVEEAMSESIEDSISKENFELFCIRIEANLNDFLYNKETENHYVNEVEQLCKNGDTVWVEISTKYQYNAADEIEAVNIIRNIDERKKTEKIMFDLSYRDHLTGLYNRRYYEKEIKRLDVEENLPLALVMADVNGLKLINDAFGHQEGDLLLQRISRILKDSCRSEDAVSRIGGDEFVIMLPNASHDDVNRFIQRIHKVVSKENKKDALTSLSIGYAIKENSQENITQIFKKAEDEMYQHKLAESTSLRSRSIDLIMNSLYAKRKREMNHSKRVSGICEEIATAMSFNQEDINQIKLAGLVHDIGKIGISNVILDKEESLTDAEWSEIKKHSEVGYRILNSVKEFSEISEYILAHHERWDGNGYPLALKGERIPVQARIITIADAYDAMTSKRSYKDEISKADAIAELKRGAGTQFDPEIVEIFLDKVIGSNTTSNS